MPFLFEAVQAAPPPLQTPAPAPAPAAGSQSAPPPQSSSTVASTPAPAPGDSEKAGTAEAQTEQAEAEQAQAVDDVIVVAERTGVRTQIDRRVYDVGRDAIAQTSSVLEILEKVPSVSVDTSGRLRLLGQSDVTVLIDGQKPANAQATLRTLTGANVERIEVMTNPGVQYGPVGTGGIINIITKQRTTPGVTGTISGSVDSYGSVSLTAAPSVTRGRWTLNTSLGLSVQDSPNRASSTREVFATPAAPAVLSEEASRGDNENRGANGTFKALYRLSDSASLNGSLELSRNVQDQHRTGRITSAGTPSLDHLEGTVVSGRYDSLAVGGGYSRTGPRDGEELTLAARVENLSIRNDTFLESDYGAASASTSRFRTLDRGGWDTQSLKLDYTRPLEEGRITTAGLSWERNGQTSDLDTEVLQGAVPPSTRRMDSARNVFAAYATIQFETAGWTVLPGLRLEYQDLEVTGAAAAGGNDSVDLYPSLHISRTLDEGLKLNLSYAKRIDRPDGWLLDPTLIYSQPLEAYRGNPDLKPQTTESFEARLDWTRPRWSLNATLYDKEKHGLWSSDEERFPDGLIVTTSINTGHGADRGLELSLRGKLGERFNYVTTTNLFASTRPVDEDGAVRQRTDFAWSGNGQLEYVAPARDGREADKVQVSVNYSGPQRSFQSESDTYFTANLTWRHPLTKRTTVVMLARNVFDTGDYRSRTETAAFREVNLYEGRGVTVRLSLSYRLGVAP